MQWISYLPKYIKWTSANAGHLKVKQLWCKINMNQENIWTLRFCLIPLWKCQCQIYICLFEWLCNTVVPIILLGCYVVLCYLCVKSVQSQREIRSCRGHLMNSAICQTLREAHRSCEGHLINNDFCWTCVKVTQVWPHHLLNYKPRVLCAWRQCFGEITGFSSCSRNWV